MGEITGGILNAGTQAMGGILGMALEKHNDKRQLKQQKKLTDIQTAAQMGLTDYSYEKQLQMWKDTNYGAQVEELKKAGLNPGLLYGMSGGGGVTTGTAGSTGVSGANAPVGGGEIMGMGLQGGMTMAQIELIKAQTEKTKAETTKTTGVDTKEAETRINSLLQGIENAKAQEHMTKVETWLKQMEGAVQGETIEDRMDFIKYATKRALTDLKNAENETYINTTTRNDKIKIIQQEAIGSALRNALTKAQTTNTSKDTELKGKQIEGIASSIQVNDAQIKNWTNQINNELTRLAQEGVKISQHTVELELKKLGLLLEESQPGIGKALSKIITDLQDEINKIKN